MSRRSTVLSLTALATLVAGCSSDANTPSARDTTPHPGPTSRSISVPSAADPSAAGAEPIPTAEPSSAVVYIDQGRIQVQPTVGPAITVGGESATQGQDHPDWSPDGSQIVFDSAAATLWVADADGSAARQVYSCSAPCVAIQDPAWAPDGRHIAFAMAESGDGSHTSRSAIVSLDLGSGDVRTVYADSSHRVWIYQPRWSPDGTSIVFEQDTFASTSLSEESVTSARIGVVSSDGRGAPTFVVSGRRSLPATPDWSPTGDVITYVQADNLYITDVDGHRTTQLTDFDGETEHALQPTFAPNGRHIVFTYVTGQMGVDDAPSAAIVDLDGNGLTVVVPSATHPRLAP